MRLVAQPDAEGDDPLTWSVAAQRENLQATNCLHYSQHWREQFGTMGIQQNLVEDK
ncbi:hypothetical protein [Chromatium okenii]|uniref:hypothetical protein n=1 Tax=Chromatium okenii TaxID=61644 RepID=UPI0015596780|nr:hypothetical protein [Chromatium okenii]